MGASVAAETRPPLRRPLIPSGVLGMLLFVFTEVMFFAGLISAHAIVRAGAQEWPPVGQPRLPIASTLFNTAALLISGAVLVWARIAFNRERGGARVPMLFALVLGLFFVGAQGREWVALLGEGLTMQSSPYGAFFYMIVGMHALHALGAILALGWALRRLWTGRLTSVQLGTVETFWYFVVLVWPLLYWKVYL